MSCVYQEVIFLVRKEHNVQVSESVDRETDRDIEREREILGHELIWMELLTIGLCRKPPTCSRSRGNLVQRK